MAYRTIANAELGIDAPIDVALMTSIRDNQEAIGLGLSGAPKVAIDALEDSITTNAVTVPDADGFPENTGINFSQEHIIYGIQVTNGSLSSGQPTASDITSLQYTFIRSGTYGFTLQVRAGSGVIVKLYNNTTLVYTSPSYSSISSDPIFFTLDYAKGEKIKMVVETATNLYYRAALLVYSSNPFADPVSVGQDSLHLSGSQFDTYSYLGFGE